MLIGVLLDALLRVFKGGRSWVQPLFQPLTQFLHHHMLVVLHLVIVNDRHIGIDLRRCPGLHGERYLVEALKHGISIKIVIEQDPPQIRMSDKSHAKEIINLALMPVRRWPDGYNAVHLWHFILHPHPELEDLPAGKRAQVVDRFQMIEHVYARNAAQQFKPELIAQKAAHGNKMASIHVQVQQILSHYLDCKFTTGDLHKRGEIPDKRGLLISIAPGFV